MGWLCCEVTKLVNCARHMDENLKTYFILTASNYFEVQIVIWRHKYQMLSRRWLPYHPMAHDLIFLFFSFPCFLLQNYVGSFTLYSPMIWVKFDLLTHGLESCTLHSWDLIVFSCVHE